MAKDTFIYGKRCRWYKACYAWVSEDGTLVVVPDKNNKFNPSGKKKLPIKTDHGGRKIAIHPDKWFPLEVAKAVAKCFCPPMPSDGKEYMISHKDGNLGNCHYQNLAWVPYHYKHATTDTVKLYFYGVTFEVGKDGSVKIDGKTAKVYDSFHDSDVDLEVCSSGPSISVPQKGSIDDEYVLIESLMAEAGYVQGDDADLKHPGILHIDNDYMNCSSENLEWTEMTDERYKAFLEQCSKDKEKKFMKKNRIAWS